jgi:hypothetical protein
MLLSDWVNWANADFHAAAKTGAGYALLVQGWHEQRQYLFAAVDALGVHPLAAVIRREWAALHPTAPSTDGYTRINPAGQVRCLLPAC